MIFTDDFFYVTNITAVPIGGSYSLVIRTTPPRPHIPVDLRTNVIIVTVIIMATSQNLLNEIYLTQIQCFQYLVIFVLTLVINT
jgi:hypothetical protein